MAGVDPLSGAVSERAAGAAQLRWRVDCAQALGAEVGAWPFHQPLGQFSGRGVTGAQWRRMVESQRTMSDYAGDLRRAIEPLNRFECYALNLAADAAGLVAAVGRPNSGYLYDRFPAHIEERDPVAVLQATMPAVRHVDVSENDRRTPGRGHAGFRPALRALKAAGYDHWISVEAFGQALPDIAAATKVWRPHFPSETQRVTEAIGLIRQIWTE